MEHAMRDSWGVITAIAALMAGFERPWAFCGGWAIDLFLGRITREHKDVDILVFRRDQLAVQSYLRDRGWTLEVAHDGVLTPWTEGEFTELPRHGIWCRNPAHAPDFLEVLLNETDGDRFLFRRDRSIELPLDRTILRTRSGLPVLAPEIVLLYKSAHPDIEENAADFRTAVAVLGSEQRAWLRAALGRMRPDHAWRFEL
jgi:hypothetical protein